MKKYKAGIIGATGYAGAELVRLLINHPYCEIEAVASVSSTGKRLDEFYPSLREIFTATLEGVDEIIPRCDVIFASVPHGVSEEIAAKCDSAGTVLIDLGADFRLSEESDYKRWYGGEYKHPELHGKSAYCIPELHRSRLAKASIIGNPGCYPTSIALGAAPAIKSGIIECDSVIIDSKSGVTGAGKALTEGTHYPETNENFAAYKAGCHRHTPEIAQTLGELAGKKVNVTFVPHLLPVNRGIESSIYLKLSEKGKAMSAEELHRVYEDAYRVEKFVRVLDLGAYAAISRVRFSNYCDISIHPDFDTGILIVSSVIDNMVKGAAGQAIQNMNIKLGVEEDAGLNLVPPMI